MRALTLVLLLLVTNASFAEAIAGKTRILVVNSECSSQYWAPLAGGPIEPIFLPTSMNEAGGCAAVSVAYDGERFLINVGGREAALFAEGASTPLWTVTLDEESSMTSSQATWDGTRYITAWRRSSERGGRLVGKAVTREGVVVDSFELNGSRRVAGLAANNRQVLVLDAPGGSFTPEFPEPEHLQVTATALDENLTPRKSLLLGHSYESFAIGGLFGRYVDVLDAKPFHNGFYATWIEAYFEWDGSVSDDAVIYGARISADGTLLGPVRTIARNAPSRDVDLVQTGDYLLAVVKREGRMPVTGTFIDKSGLPIGTREFLHDHDEDLTIEAVRMPDGKVALLTKPRFGAIATVTLVNSAPPLPRRRAVR